MPLGSTFTLPWTGCARSGTATAGTLLCLPGWHWAVYSHVVLQAQESYLQSCVKEEEPGPITKGWGGQGLPAAEGCHQLVPVYVGG